MQQEYVTSNPLEHTDLNMYQCGHERCDPSHSFGPAVRDHFLIHYILEGKGIFQVGDKTYHLEKGQGFLICPNMVTYYEAGPEDPWHYCWVGFHGLKADYYLKCANLSAESPIFRYDQDDRLIDCFKQMFAAKKVYKTIKLQLMGYLCLFLSLLIETADGPSSNEDTENRTEQYVRRAVEFIQMNYSRKIGIDKMAHDIGLDRSYLCALFKKVLNRSPQEFLIRFRMDKACELMKNNTLSIGDIARSVGYEDPLLFSKIFKKVKGATPREFRKLL